jgi:hypothetical protein
VVEAAGQRRGQLIQRAERVELGVLAQQFRRGMCLGVRQQRLALLVTALLEQPRERAGVVVVIAHLRQPERITSGIAPVSTLLMLRIPFSIAALDCDARTVQVGPDRHVRKSMLAGVDIQARVCVWFCSYQRDKVKQAREMTELPAR